jgi:hypothetical protein
MLLLRFIPGCLTGWVFFLSVLLSPVVHADDFVAGYAIDGDYLILGSTMRDEKGTLLDFEKMTPDQISTIYHEMWHAYVDLVSDKSPLVRDMVSVAEVRYAEFPKDKRVEIHEEAVGNYLDAVVGTYIQIRRILMQKPPERRKELLSNPRFQRIWTRLFEDSYTGYYTASIRESSETSSSLKTKKPIDSHQMTTDDLSDAQSVLDPFVKKAENAGLPVGYLRETIGRLQGIYFLDSQQGQIIADVKFSKKSLEPSDMQEIGRLLLEDRLTSDTHAVFDIPSQTSPGLNSTPPSADK